MRASWRRALLLVWAVAVVVQAVLPRGPVSLPQRDRTTLVHRGDGEVRIAWNEQGPADGSLLLLIHGSPGDAGNFDAFRARLRPELRVIAVDLPGFGASTRALDDFSIRSQAADLVNFLDEIGVSRAHVVGMSMGGGVALEMAQMAPGRIASLTLLSSIGFQEMELTGDYWTNHLVHGAQLALLWLVDHLVPHFGLLDTGGLARSYARNFYDSDQRRLDDALLRWKGPALVLHGEDDFLVPVEAARLHAQVLPGSGLRIYADGGHFLLWTEPAALAEAVGDFVGAAGGDSGRLAPAPRPRPDFPPLRGPGLWLLLVFGFVAAALFAPAANWWCATFVAAGRVAAFPLGAALVAGAVLGALLRGPRHRGAALLGAALAGGLHFAIVSSVFGARRSVATLLLSIALWFALRTAWELRTAWSRGRMRGKALRLLRWEYWPAWAVYGPVVPRLWWRARSLGGLRVAGCVNPDIPLGGLVGESKSAILDRIGRREEMPAHVMVPEGSVEERVARVAAFQDELASPWPVVIKPDRGERGTGVRIARDEATREQALREVEVPVIAQEYVEGQEYGVFWYRRPGAGRGAIFSVTSKEPLVVFGDGERSLAELILAEPRALPVLDHLRRIHRDALDAVPDPGEPCNLTPVGAHVLGTTFRDARQLGSDALRSRLDGIMSGAPGLDFGRFDLRAPSADALAAGRHLRILEFNGLSAEAAHVYDPAAGWGEARDTLLEQWTLALEIGAARAGAGAMVPSWAEVLRTWREHRGDHPRRGGWVRSGR